MLKKIRLRRRRNRLMREAIQDLSPGQAAGALRLLSRNGFHDRAVMVQVADRALEAPDLHRSERAALTKYREVYASGRKVLHKSTADYPTETEQQS